MMSKVFADISTSLDGFITGPDDSVAVGLGINGERLHEWIYNLAGWRERHGLTGGTQNRNSQIVDEAVENTGAFVMGKRMFDHGLPHWGDNPPFHMPVFVLTHEVREPLVKEGGTTFTFINDGVESALRHARAAAGDKDISVIGGANIIQQFMNANLLDEIQIHIVPILLGGGKRLFDHLNTGEITLGIDRVVESPDVTHIRYSITR